MSSLESSRCFCKSFLPFSLQPCAPADLVFRPFVLPKFLARNSCHKVPWHIQETSDVSEASSLNLFSVGPAVAICKASLPACQQQKQVQRSHVAVNRDGCGTKSQVVVKATVSCDTDRSFFETAKSDSSRVKLDAPDLLLCETLQPALCRPWVATRVNFLR